MDSKTHGNSLTQTITTASNLDNKNTSKQRLDCLICHYQSEANESNFTRFPYRLRALRSQIFKSLGGFNYLSIYKLYFLELELYYAKHLPTHAKLIGIYRLLYEKLCQQLTKHWFSKSYSLLNYGWGVQRQFLQYLRQEGFTNCYVYDSYASEEGFGNPKSLQQGAFDYILLQNVIEYVEDHHVLLSQLNSLLSPGSYLLICTRDAVSIKLNQPDSNHYSNERYVPYLLHIYFRESLELLAFFPGWDFLDFFHRSYSNMYWFGFNTSVWTEYQRLFNNSVNIFYEPIKLWKVLTFYAFIFYSIFGYELSLRTYTFLIFRRRICLPHTHLRQEG